jgi:hypothetical protein
MEAATKPTCRVSGDPGPLPVVVVVVVLSNNDKSLPKKLIPNKLNREGILCKHFDRHYTRNR